MATRQQRNEVQKHCHKFRRHTYKSGSSVYFCAMPDCNVKTSPALALGKRTICWRCGEPFIMNEYSIRLAKPHCEGCHKPKTTGFISYEAQTLVGPNPTAATLEQAVRSDSISDLRSRLSGITKVNSESEEDDGEI